MAQLMDHVTYLSKEIGPRPAGTEEEQRAALYITEQFQKETGFTASMEEFSSSSNVEVGLAVMAAIAVVVTILAMIFPVLVIPAFILAVAAAVVYSLEELDKPIISRVLSRGASQNVVAKYQPNNVTEGKVSRRSTSRKIVLLAHYDTSNVTPPIVARVESLGIPIALVCVGGIIAAAFFLLIRIFVASGGGMALLVLNVLSIISILICLYPIAKAILIRTSPYNEGATNNATGTAALIEVARRIARGSVSEAELADVEDDEVVIHGEEAARIAGLIPEGAQIVYEAEKLVPPAEIGDYDEEERLLSAKAAIAALTGKPVERKVYSSVASNLVNSRVDEEAINDIGLSSGDDSASRLGATTFEAASYSNEAGKGESIEGFENAPSWFVAAQQNARKPESERNGAEPQIKRSKYIEAIEEAERSRAQYEEEMRAAEQAAREEALRAREEEIRAAMLERANLEEQSKGREQAEQQQEAIDGNSAPGFVPIVYNADGSDSGLYSQQGTEPSPAQSPYGTIAMPAPIPSSEIIAEALAEDAATSSSSIPNPAEESKPVLAAASIPDPAASADSPARVSVLPSIDPADPYSASSNDGSQLSARRGRVTEQSVPSPEDSPSRSGILRKLRTNIPSLSGLISPVPSKPENTKADRRREKIDYDMEIPIVTPQESSNASSTEQGVVEIPRSRSGNLMNRLRQTEGEDLTDTPQQWLDVDENFDPRSVGRERGGWESFRDDGTAGNETAGVTTRNDNGNSKADIRWQGGAYSRVQLGHVDTRSGEDAEADKPLIEEQIDDETENTVAEEIEQIYHFRNPLFSNEVWFVAIGADGVSHDGARAFIEEHRDELRGSMMIEIESLGAGNLSVASEEGRIRKVVASSRVKRYTRAATATTGIAVNNVSLKGTDSIASTLQKAGFQAMHLFGAEKGRPALKGSADDVSENVDEIAFDEHVNYVYEMLKQ